jgi:hypothetical protein
MFRTAGADFQANSVIVNGTNGSEPITGAGEAFVAFVLRQAALVNITLAKPGLDRLTVNALDGDDTLIGGLSQHDLHCGPGPQPSDSVIEREGCRGHERYCRS